MTPLFMSQSSRNNEKQKDENNKKNKWKGWIPKSKQSDEDDKDTVVVTAGTATNNNTNVVVAASEETTTATTAEDKSKAEEKSSSSSSSPSFIEEGLEDFDINDLVIVGSATHDMRETDAVIRQMSSELGVRQMVPRKGEQTFPFELLLERTLDTLEDIFVITRRKIEEMEYNMDITTIAPQSSKKNTTTSTTPIKDTRETIVILGSGWAAHALLKVADTSKVRIICISPSNHFVFTPMLASAAVGTVEYSSMTESVRASNPLIDNYIEGSATDIDIQQKVVTVQCKDLLEGVVQGAPPPPTMEISYDKLVVAVGGQVADFGIPGASNCLRLKSCDDARKLRTAIGECFEYASRPDCVLNDYDNDKIRHEKLEEKQRRVTFLIVGGGPTGVELAGEISDLAQDVTRKKVGAYQNLDNCIQVILVHSGSEVLQQFEPELRQEALVALQRRGIDVRLNTYVTRVENDYVVLKSKETSSDENELETLPVGITVWCAGAAPVPFVSTLLKNLPEEARGQSGRIRVDKWLRPIMGNDGNNNNNNKNNKYDSSLLGSIFVLGDAADFVTNNGKTTKTTTSPPPQSSSSYLPQTAQVAGQQGAYLARLFGRGYNLNAPIPVLHPLANQTTAASYNYDQDTLLETWLVLRGLEAAPGFSFMNLGLLAYLGGGQALSQVQVGDYSLFKWAGSVAFVLWRSVYLVKQVATKNRVLVTFDWIKSFIFGRDVTRL